MNLPETQSRRSDLLLELLASVALLIWVAFYPRLKPSAGGKQRQKAKE